MAVAAKSKHISDDVLAVLSTMECEGSLARITGGQLDRKLYQRVNEVLEALGGKWKSGKIKAHAFDGDAAERIEQAILTRSFEKPGDFGYFPTPPELVETLVQLTEYRDGMTILEPSAGQGAIVKGLLKVADIACMTLVELLPKNWEILESLGMGEFLLRGDFLACDEKQLDLYERIVMNPPFAPSQADIDHVMHAWKFLAPGGRIVAIMSAGVKFRENRKTVDFRAFVWSHDGEIIDNPEGSFKTSGTSVSTVTVVVDKNG
jgi:type I restriction-modification system DNA methylase subunit